MATDPKISNETVESICQSMRESPDEWVFNGKVYSDGYHFVSPDGATYGMGMATYEATDFQRDSLFKPVIDEIMAARIFSRNAEVDRLSRDLSCLCKRFIDTGDAAVFISSLEERISSFKRSLAKTDD